MLNQPTIKECTRKPVKWKIIKTKKGYLFALFREVKDGIENIAETNNFTEALQFEKVIHPEAKENPLLEFGMKLKDNIERRLSGKEEKFIELTSLKQWRKDAKQPNFDQFGNANNK